jgi:hypothetical protein
MMPPASRHRARLAKRGVERIYESPPIQAAGKFGGIEL